MSSDRLELLSSWDFEEELVPDGYDMRGIPKATSKNMEILMEKINTLCEVVRDLQAKVEGENIPDPAVSTLRSRSSKATRGQT